LASTSRFVILSKYLAEGAAGRRGLRSVMTRELVSSGGKYGAGRVVGVDLEILANREVDPTSMA
jgi:hypothetical protein